MKNQENYTTRSSIKVKVHPAQTISSYPMRFSTDILFPSLALFAFCLFIIFLHIRLCGRANDKKKFHPADFRKQDYFLFGLITYYSISLFFSFSHFCFSAYLHQWSIQQAKSFSIIITIIHYMKQIKNIKCTI